MTDNPADISEQPPDEAPTEASDEAPTEASDEGPTEAPDDEAPTEAPDEAPTEAQAWSEGDDLPVAQARELFVVLGKALRAFQLYDENNPVRRRFVTNLRETFEKLWQEVEGLNLAVEEDRLLLGGQAIYENPSRSDSLAFLLYKDGVRDVTFLPGFEGPELDKVLGVLQRARMLKTAEADDLLTMLWEEDLEFFKCQYVAQFTEGAVVPTAQAVEERANLAQVIQGEAEAAQAEEDKAGTAKNGHSPPKIGQDFSPKSYALEPEEMAELKRALAAEMSRDVRHDVLSALFDRLEDPERSDRKSEILKIIRELLPGLLSRGAIESVANILEELAAVRAEPGILDEVHQMECDILLDDLSSTETLEELVRALQDGTVDVPVEVLGRFLSHLRVGALPVLLGAAEQEELPGLKDTLRGAVHGIAKQNPEAVLALLGNVNPVVISGAVRLIGRMGMAEAAAELAGLMLHQDADVRLALVETAELLREDLTTETLVGALSDAERDVRLAAARALASLGHEKAVPVLKEMVTGKEIRQLDLTEKIAIFESYGALGGAEAATVLSGLLNKKTFFGQREPSEIRASAARALGKAGFPGAEEALSAAQGDEDAVVRTAVRQAIAGFLQRAEPGVKPEVDSGVEPGVEAGVESAVEPELEQGLEEVTE